MVSHLLPLMAGDPVSTVQRKAREHAMSCKDTIHLICWYLEGKLSPSVEAEIERHLTECADCHLVLDAANSTLDRYFSESATAPTGEGSKAA